MATDDEAATDKISQLRGVTWEWREDAPEDAKAQPGIGVIAQEVERVFPELVTTDDQGRKKVEYEGLIAPLIEAVKELDERVRSLEEQISGRRQKG
ncbi:MAG: tail fiber domain-containing protein [Actinobacteria bacterium]|nr:tail fiber domain-containing protein [Actinomycetota bacterium]